MLPSPVKQAGIMNPRSDWVVTFRMTGTSTETDPADRCATAPHAALSLQNLEIGCCLVKGTQADRRAPKGFSIGLGIFYRGPRLLGQ